VLGRDSVSKPLGSSAMNPTMNGKDFLCSGSRSLIAPRTPGARGLCSYRPTRLVVKAAATKDQGVLDVVKKAFGKADEEETRFRWNPAQSRSVYTLIVDKHAMRTSALLHGKDLYCRTERHFERTGGKV
jgi:hypothetical protein